MKKKLGQLPEQVVFGCNVDKEKINETLILIRNSSLNIDKIEFKKMEIDNDTFLLKESLIKPSA